LKTVDEPTIPQTATFQLKLPSFEGPLDLLLHLIKKHELNVLDLPIAFVTERYLEYLSLMEELDLDVASEYLLMAATLAHIKSKMLLPQTPTNEAFEEQDEGYQEDPRAELIRRLLEYQKYKAAAEDLGGRPMAGRDVFPRGMPAPVAQGPSELAPIDMYKLLDAFQAILKRVQGRVALEVTAERITIHERMTQLSDFLRARRACTFEELFEGARTRYEVVVTFLALLEMTKLRMTRVYQADPKSTLHVAYALLDENGELAEGMARAFEGVTADSAPPAEEFAPAAFEDEAAAAADGCEASETADDAWVRDQEPAADGGKDAHDAWTRDEADEDAEGAQEAIADGVHAADGGEESQPVGDAWMRDEAPAADGGEELQGAPDVRARGESAAERDELAVEDEAWAGEERIGGADDEAGAAVERVLRESVGVNASEELTAAIGGDDAERAALAAESSAHDAWTREPPLAADGGENVERAALAAESLESLESAAHDAWTREPPLAADGGEDAAAELEAAPVAEAPVAHDAWVRERAAAVGGEDPSADAQPAAAETRHELEEEAAQDEAEPVSPKTDEWKP
jgi:segregation and condensation protein A